MRSMSQSSTALVLLTLGAAVAQAEPVASKRIDFSAQIRPILSARCFRCHGPDEASREAKLRLDLRDEAVREHRGRRAITPGDIERSQLVKRITATDDADVMPPVETKHPLEPAEIELLKQWVLQGAPYAPHWGFIKPERPRLPPVTRPSWARNGIDRFVLARLEEAELGPSAPADRFTLLRRVSLDLTGLPPTPEQVEAFARDERPDAYERVVGRLLSSPAFGEKLARMWLDLARFADSAGYGSDPLRPDLWPYRDWVIDAFNRNVPYDRFTLDQIAGDLLPRPARATLVATAFHRNTMTNSEGGTDDEEWRVAAVKDRANVTAQVWMGLTMGCAQCHTHKFDPITQREYYQFYAFFNQTADSDKRDERPTLPLWTPAQEKERKKLQAEIDRVKARYERSTPAFERELAAWQRKAAQPIPWVGLRPVAARAASGARLTVEADGAVVATGPVPGRDVYTVEVRADADATEEAKTNAKMTAFRIEAFGGRATDRGFALSDVEARIRVGAAKPVRARFVRIEAAGPKRVLSLAEVEATSGGVNVARAGRARQSSVELGARAARAVDGNTDGDFALMSSTRTTAEDDPWWELDLGRTHPLDEVAIWNRTDGETDKLANTRVVLLDEKRGVAWEAKISDAPEPTARFALDGAQVLALVGASADAEAEGGPARAAIDKDGLKTGWSVAGGAGKAHAIAFETKTPVELGPDAVLSFILTQVKGDGRTLARFRLSATGQAAPVRILPQEVQAIVDTPAARRSRAQRVRLAGSFRPLSIALAPLRAELQRRTRALESMKSVALPVMRELPPDKRRVTNLLNKGNFLDPGDPIAQPGVPAAFHAWPAGASLDRVGLVAWLMSPDNPLTARVAVNRFWAQLFGAGLVETEEDFGTQGALPTHRDLLDWLAVTFSTPTSRATPAEPALGWDMKALVKLMVTSATYRQASTVTPELLEKDPRNLLHSRAGRRRLDAETIRDQALALGGLLSPKLGGPSVFPPQPDGLWRAAFNGERTWSTSKGEDRYRRGLYTFLRRTVPYPSMTTFDAPSREACSMRRTNTNTPLQAFVTLNDPVFFEAAQALGRRLVREGGATPLDRVRYGLRLALARPPAESEVRSLVALFESERAHYRQAPEDAMKVATDPLGPLPPGILADEAAAWSVVGNVLLNLDGVLTRG